MSQYGIWIGRVGFYIAARRRGKKRKRECRCPFRFSMRRIGPLFHRSRPIDLTTRAHDKVDEIEYNAWTIPLPAGGLTTATLLVPPQSIEKKAR
eukprot:373688-Pyramimonas_sp.AAC.1